MSCKNSEISIESRKKLRARVDFMATVQREGVTVAYSEEVMDQVLEELMAGKVPAEILGPERPPEYPGLTYFYKLIRDDESFAKKYARAMEVRTEADVDKIREIVMAPAVEVSSEYGSHVDSGDVALRRLQVDALKWAASKRLPKKYGDKLELAGDKASPVSIVVKRYAEDGNPVA